MKTIIYTEEHLNYLAASYTYSVDGTVYNKHGRPVGCYARKYGRLNTKIGKINIARLLWFFDNGVWPVGEIDHIDGDTHNNKLSNLRVCSRSENAKNKKRYYNNTTGYKGVTRESYRGEVRSYRASIQNEGVRIHLGMFDTAVDAAQAYNTAAKRLHGEFARLNTIER
tara:strand:- start:525 stop:1028 length:504 start_codon:yes stop_codon:yes gene_type:complete